MFESHGRFCLFSAEERVEVEFDNKNVFRTNGLLVSLILDEEVEKKHATCVSVMHTGTDTRDLKCFKGTFGDALNELVIQKPVDRGIQHDEKAVTDALTAESVDLNMGKLAKTVKGVFKSVRERKIKSIALVFGDEIEFSEEHFNKGAPEGRLIKHVLPVEHTKTIRNAATKKEQTCNHMGAVLVFRAFVTRTDVPVDDASDVESDDEMQQIARRTAGLKL